MWLEHLCHLHSNRLSMFKLATLNARKILNACLMLVVVFLVCFQSNARSEYSNIGLDDFFLIFFFRKNS